MSGRHTLSGRNPQGEPHIFVTNMPSDAKQDMEILATQEGWTDLQWERQKPFKQQLDESRTSGQS